VNDRVGFFRAADLGSEKHRASAKQLYRKSDHGLRPDSFIGATQEFQRFPATFAFRA
jgi:hypothetical protein